MLEEMKELVSIVNSLPQLALWVAIGFWAYKVIIVGSVYGLIRLVVQRGYAAYMSPDRQRIEIAIDGVVTFHNKQRLIAELSRLMPQGMGGTQQESESLSWLHDAITEKMEKDGPPKK